MELIKGKWYKVANHNLYFKYYEIKKQNEIYYFESIVDTNYIDNRDWLSISNTITEVELSEIFQWLPENHPDKQLKPEDFIGKWVTCNNWANGSYCLVKSVIKSFPDISIWYSKSLLKSRRDTNDIWIIDNLSDLTIVSEAEVAKKAIEYGHDLRELGLHQFLAVFHKPIINKEDLYNTKIWIGDNKELSRKVQERLFELGFKWNTGEIVELCYYALFLNNNKIFAFRCTKDSDFEYFKEHEYKEIALSDLGLNNESLIQKGLEVHNQIEQSLNSIIIIPVTKINNINIPEIKLNNKSLIL